MKRLWAPWRIEYIRSKKEKGCLFCRCFQEGVNRDRLVLVRNPECLCLLNRYPYNNGHLMVAPATHCARLADLPRGELIAMMNLVQRAERLLSRTLRPEGFNIGFNLGRAAGAGIKDHLHLHVVPRWNGDTNFMPVLGDVRVISQSLEDLYDTLLTALGQEGET
ncbi:MAG: HIT domain-containing protein [Planctomycetes bacterium]|nr:HIT domain-containing protein [Planctomycetota bacterium]